MGRPKSVHILHISDLHLGKLDEKRKHGLVNESGESQLASVVSTQLERHFGRHIDFVVVCGDFVWQGMECEDHRNAADALYDLCLALGITDPTKVFLVPGNHDVGKEPTPESLPP